MDAKDRQMVDEKTPVCADGKTCPIITVKREKTKKLAPHKEISPILAYTLGMIQCPELDAYYAMQPLVLGKAFNPDDMQMTKNKAFNALKKSYLTKYTN